MATVQINAGSNVGTSLTNLLLADDLIPGYAPSYELCKQILLFHPLGQKMAEGPVRMAQSKPRTIRIPDGPEEVLAEVFRREWDAIGADKYARNVMKLARTYGISSLVMGSEGGDTSKPVTPEEIVNGNLYFNVADPLNTAGSLVLDQNPNSPGFQKPQTVMVAGQDYHRSRCVVVMNEEPVYISYTSSAFGFVGRSVFQRALFPLKSFVQTMVADDMIAAKLGLLISKMKQPGSIVDNLMISMMGMKRATLKAGVTGNVLGIGIDEAIETLNMINADGAGNYARNNIIANIATAADMPAVLLRNETFTQGFGEGSEDARAVAQYINGVREDMRPIYSFLDRIVMRRAWNPEFYAYIQTKFPMYQKISYENAFFAWANSFDAQWPSFIEEPPSERVKVDEIKFRSLISAAEVILPKCDPENTAVALKWLADNMNANKEMVTTPLELDWESLATYTPPQSVENDLGDNVVPLRNAKL